MELIDAVNEMLTKSGLGTCVTIPTSVTDVTGYHRGEASGFAAGLLLETARRVENMPWHAITRRDVEVEPILFEITDAGWTQTGYILTDNSGDGIFADASEGMTLTLTAAGGNEAGDYVVATLVDDDHVTLTSDINDGGGNIASGITGDAATNAIVLPAGTITVKPYGADAYRKITTKGNRLFDLDDNTNQFSDTIKVEHTTLTAFGCLPEPLAAYISARAAAEFCLRWPGAMKTLYRELKVAEREAFIEANLWNNRQENASMLDTPDARQFRGGRPEDPRVYID